MNGIRQAKRVRPVGRPPVGKCSGGVGMWSRLQPCPYVHAACALVHQADTGARLALPLSHSLTGASYVLAPRPCCRRPGRGLRPGLATPPCLPRPAWLALAVPSRQLSPLTLPPCFTCSVTRKVIPRFGKRNVIRYTTIRYSITLCTSLTG